MEEAILYFVLAGLVVLLLLILNYLKGNNIRDKEQVQNNLNANIDRNPPAANRRGNAIRNRRIPQRRHDSDSENEPLAEDRNNQLLVDGGQISDDDEQQMLNDPKLGAKKRAKLEAKIEKRAQREAEEKIREEKKKKDAKLEEERKKAEIELEAEEKRKEDEEKRLEEEKRKREEEEYLEMKSAFTIEEEGCDVNNKEEEENLLQNFLDYIMEKKVILFEELATKFSLKVPEAIDRLTRLISSRRLTGVMDDRGKFIYISENELIKFAKFIKQRGRVSIVDLVENSNQIIKLSNEKEVLTS